MLYAVTAIVFLAIGYVIGAIRNAADGWEDADGFHYGEPD